MVTEFISRKYGTEGYEVIIKTDDEKHYNASAGFARALIDHEKPKTNADRIRAMSDEHLANYLMQFTDLDCRIGFCQNLPKCEALLDTEYGIPISMCEKCLLKWLRQPAEDNC